MLGEGALVAPGSNIDPGTVIGDHTAIAGACQITGEGAAIIGPYCAIAGELLIVTGNHSMRHPNVLAGLHARHGWASPLTPGDVSIGAACWVEARVTILPGVSIGDGAVVGAGSVVTRDVDSFTVVAGVPARPLRRRCTEDVAATLQDVAWWNWSPERIARNRAFFEGDIAASTPAELHAAVRT